MSSTHRVQLDNKLIEPFQREKILLSINDAIQHRKHHLKESVDLTDTVLEKLVGLSKALLSSNDIATTIYDVLKRFDATGAEVFRAKHIAND